MSRSSSHFPDALPLFADTPPTSWSHSLKGWLWRHRLLVVLTAVWLGLIGVATLAYSELLFTGRTLQANRPAPQSAAISEPSLPSSSPDPSSTAPMTMETATIPWWSMAALVGTCALGCLTISKRLQAPPRTRQRRRRSSRRPSRRPTVPTVKRLQPRTGEEPLVSSEATPPQAGTKPSSPAGQQGASPATTAATSSPGSTSAAVTVVPADHPHPLDVPDSLVHDLDLRQRRPLSSLL
ncbi:hypothetical protein XM38_028160 [Halomicronema hongdechloris C2206]|uniref:Transmembrane protein n=1 Tax=Halomicronema hongdechloris C2206 TaxID=1641165 RepID=A0A1Z3HNJ7_9CYAN|nr:hypothetical protein [Halomicronema hongdechloris]ASC71862.1 hypothetical protein XM38_028160 [Halomicronema hongdechloris C2206]